ncbi:TRAP transporter permease [Dysosmobacter sp.]|uniref:TRAP transporter permease n=1 Tax=Dysosmobacter sp. TaxID=2591382 RepID=UPI002A89CDE5|nr:TRAP transporter permease [Dysosmobacter sp.]MDY3282777.1 TRAP transporter permease [Dysosmobacter sp.]
MSDNLKDTTQTNAEEHKSALDSIEMLDVEENLKKYDSESVMTENKGIMARVVTVMAMILSVFQLYLASPWGTVPSAKARAIHLGFVMALIFLNVPIAKKKDGTLVNFVPWNVICAALALICNLYLCSRIDLIAANGGVLTQLDYAVCVIIIVLVLTSGRRSIGSIMCILPILFLLYAYFGKSLPGILHHRGFGIPRLLKQMVTSSEGIYGIPLGVSCSTIFLFVLFGAFLSETGLSELFTNVALAIAGDRDGGPAKVSIVASGFLGMINGSAAANVVTTGAFTIPLMKKLGYQNHFAGAVEAVASTGGQIMPPVMGAAAFIMAEYLGVSYRTIIIYAIIPAVLYYVALWINVDLEAKRTGLKGYPKDQLPKIKEEMKLRGHMLIPVVLLIALLMMNYSASYACFLSIVALIIVSSLKKNTRLNLKSLVRALENGAKQGMSVAIATAVCGMIVGVVNMTGIGLQLANIIIKAAGGNLFLTMLFTMLACVVLGMGMPTSAAYIVAATVATGAMTSLGVAKAGAHLFVLYYAALSAITPPVALASYAGAGVAGANPNKVGWTAVRIGLLAFVIPFIFVYSPELMMLQGNALQIIWAFVTACIGCYCLGGAMIGYYQTNLKIYERAALLVGAICLIVSGIATDAVGIVLLAVVFLAQLKRSKKKAAA